ncbi:UNVERIFIED_CONTAM: hypothetical protein PYX00_001628 [Menopon gallinae]|uniref:Secreted protein n=1 Tax=Menopon gallinae TaxID=328185 RepID=A0AAW2ID34_9NEOP
MVWRSVLVVVVLCAAVSGQQASRSTKVTIQSTTRASTKSQVPAVRVNYKSVKRSPIATLTLQNDTTAGTGEGQSSTSRANAARNR